jgi:hypothetical protein
MGPRRTELGCYLIQKETAGIEPRMSVVSNGLTKENVLYLTYNSNKEEFHKF